MADVHQGVTVPVPAKSKYPMLEVAECLARIRDNLPKPRVESRPLRKARGLVLARNVSASEDMPPFPASIMDGYAVRSADKLAERTIVSVAMRAGVSPDAGNVGPGEAAYVTTGAPIPKGADAVVKVEDVVTTHGGKIRLLLENSPAKGVHIRPKGCDVTAGDVVLREGMELGSAEIGLLASVGCTHIPVFSPARVGVVSTGDELVPACTETLPPGKIRDSNGALLEAAVADVGAEAIIFPSIVKDDVESVAASLRDMSASCDILITTGGVSMGDRDLVKPCLEDIGTMLFGRMCMKPGKPTTAAIVSRPDGNACLVLALPGNPVSCAVTFQLLVAPAIRALGGRSWDDAQAPQMHVRLAQELKLDPERPEYHRAILVYDDVQQTFLAFSTGVQRSSRLLSMREANALLMLPKQAGSLAPGSIVRAMIIGRLGATASADALGRARDAAASTRPASHHCGCHDAKTTTSHHWSLGILTVSDRCSRGEAEDQSGPRIGELLAPVCDIAQTSIVADDQSTIQSTLVNWCDSLKLALIVTTGGTGMSPRDVTPEATRAVIEREAPGLAHAMMDRGLGATKMAALSRSVCGIRGRTLIVNLPGSKKAVAECAEVLLPLLPHALRLISGANDETGHRAV